MKKKKKRLHTSATADPNFNAGIPPEPPPARIVVTSKGDLQKQYPARLGYHGTDNEQNLSPEE